MIFDDIFEGARCTYYETTIRKDINFPIGTRNRPTGHITMSEALRRWDRSEIKKITNLNMKLLVKYLVQEKLIKEDNEGNYTLPF